MWTLLLLPLRSDVAAVFVGRQDFGMSPMILLKGLLAAVIFAGSSAALQAAVTISPVIVNLASDGRSIITVRNDRLHEVLYQISVLRWHQVDGADRYDATEDFIASPPLFTLAPAASQIVRVGLRKPVPQANEQSYRLLIAEVPQPDDKPSEPGVVQFVMQYAIPVFVAPSQRSENLPLIWRIRKDADSVVLRAENPASSHVVLNMVGLTPQWNSESSPEFVNRRRVVILAHAWQEWRFPIRHDKPSLLWRIVFSQNDSAVTEVVPGDGIHPNAH